MQTIYHVRLRPVVDIEVHGDDFLTYDELQQRAEEKLRQAVTVLSMASYIEFTLTSPDWQQANTASADVALAQSIESNLDSPASSSVQRG